MSKEMNIYIFRTFCKNCLKMIDLTEDNEKKKAFCCTEGNDWWCENCFEYMDLSILFDDDYIPSEKMSCRVCNNIYYNDSKQHYKKCYNCKELRMYNNICSKKCLKNYLFDILPNNKQICKICLKHYSSDSIYYYFDCQKNPYLQLNSRICSDVCYNNITNIN